MSLDLETAVALLVSATVALPLASFAVVGTLEVLGRLPDDRRLAQLARLVFLTTTSAALAAAVLYVVRGAEPVHHVFGHWFDVESARGGQNALEQGAFEHYGFDLGVLVDATSLTYLVLTAVLSGTVGAFSLRYLQGERGAGRFFHLLMLFAAALSLLVLAESLDLLFVGWELVGVTSALLIAFYRDRRGPVRHGLLAFAIYRVCDVGLLASLVVLHHATGTGSLPGATAHGLSAGAATLLGLLVLGASLGKSAQWPVSGWLPRAMEGPTPSSAIFYGALSVHAGAYLLLRTAPLYESSLVARGAIIFIGAASALTGTFAGRAQTDAKSSLAYASVAQVGLIFIEIGLGLHALALLHVVGHATLRTLELLRAPSLLEDHLRHEAELGARVPRTGRHYDRALPTVLRERLYLLALERGHLDALAARLLIAARGVLRSLDRADRSLAAHLDGERLDEVPSLPELERERESQVESQQTIVTAKPHAPRRERAEASR